MNLFVGTLGTVLKVPFPTYCHKCTLGLPNMCTCTFRTVPKVPQVRSVPWQLHREKKVRAIKVRSSPRLISTGQLNALLRLHTRPIDLMVYQESYLVTQWEI